MDKKKSRPEAAKVELRLPNGNTAQAQRRRLLVALRRSPVTTIAARRDLDILCPAARVLELRRQGHLIDTVWTAEHTDCGRLHRVALYVLLSKGA